MRRSWRSDSDSLSADTQTRRDEELSEWNRKFFCLVRLIRLFNQRLHQIRDSSSGLMSVQLASLRVCVCVCVCVCVNLLWQLCVQTVWLLSLFGLRGLMLFVHFTSDSYSGFIQTIIIIALKHCGSHPPQQPGDSQTTLCCYGRRLGPVAVVTCIVCPV